MLSGQGFRSVVQAVYLVMITRALGSSGYGVFISVVSFVMVILPFASWGSGNLLVKNVARRPELFPVYWGRVLFFVAVMGTLMVAGVVLVLPLILSNGISVTLVLTLASADLVFTCLLEASGQAFQAFQRLKRTAQFRMLLSCSRLTAAAVLFVLVSNPSPAVWAYLYLGSSGFSAVVAVCLVHRELALPRWRMKGAGAELLEGFYFSVGLSTQNILNNLDKTILGRMAGMGVAGVYGAAYRIIIYAFTPVVALLYAAYARFFQHGEGGVERGRAFAYQLLPLAMGYGVLAGLGLYIFAPLLPLVLGDDFRESVVVVRWLSPLAFLKSVHFFAADTLTGAGHQAVRSAVQLVAAGIYAVLTIGLVSIHGWRGAALACLLTNVLLALALWLAVLLLCRKNRRRGVPEAAAEES
jgi:O-antigen/teichoic acid export membrane protein